MKPRMNTDSKKWPVYKLSNPDVCVLNPKKREVSSLPDDTLISFVPMAKVDDISGLMDALSIKKIGEVRKGYTYFAEGDVVFAKITPCMENGKSAIARGLHNDIGFGTTEFHVLRPGPLVIPEWLHFFVRRLEFRLAAKKSMQGAAGQQRVPIDFLRCSEIPIPPLDEQRRIVARIEELTHRAEKAQKLQQEVMEEIDKSLAATVDAVFNERDEDWTVATVKQLCGKPQYGYTTSATNEQVGPRFLRITDIQNGQVDWDSVPYCSCDEPEKYRLSDGDIVFARTGATTGKSYLVRKPPESVFASYLIRIRPGERVLSEYIWWYFQSSSYWSSVFNGIENGNRPNMNGSKLGELKIPFPRSKKTQRQIVSRLEALAEKMSELRHLQTTAEAELSIFQPALLAKAFRGEL